MTCLKYYVKLNSDGFPIPGTMQGYAKDPCDCTKMLIPATQMSIPDCQRFQPTGLRYFYQVKSGKIVPNSLISTKVRPTAPCYLELYISC